MHPWARRWPFAHLTTVTIIDQRHAQCRLNGATRAQPWPHLHKRHTSPNPLSLPRIATKSGAYINIRYIYGFVLSFSGSSWRRIRVATIVAIIALKHLRAAACNQKDFVACWTLATGQRSSFKLH